ncbi:MAG: hypothetical protein AB3N16_11385, partial [Flavobacteriaceae bacterium]
MESVDKALVLTRLSALEMQTITPLNGALVYNTDTQCVHYYDGSQWINLCDAASAGISLINNKNGTYTFSDANGIQTTFYGAPETTSTLVQNTDGSYTYTDEEGTDTHINFTDSDAQNLLTNGNPGNISIDNGNEVTLNVDDNDSVIGNEFNSDISFDGTHLTVTDGGGGKTVDISSVSTDNQVISLSGNTLTLEDGGTVDLSAYLDNTDDQAISLSGNTLTLEDGGTVDLSAYLDNTDDQNISLSGNTLTLEDGGTIDLSGYLDNTDEQDISGSGLSGTTLTIGIENGGNETVDLSSLVGTDDQAISLSGNT